MTEAASRQQDGYKLWVGDARDLRLSVVKAPQVSLVSSFLTLDSDRQASRSGRVVRAATGGSGQFAMSALQKRAYQVLPDMALSVVPPTSDVSVPEQAQYLREVAGNALEVDLEQNFGCNLPAWWRGAADQPRRWLDSFAAASIDGWAVIEPAWRWAQPLLDREARRVGTAVVRGGLDALLNNLHPRIRYDAGEITVAGACKRARDLGDRQLVLIPMMSGPDRIATNFEHPDVVYLGYPVTGFPAGGQLAASPDPGRDALALVLGRARAQLLRVAQKPITITALAGELCCEPGTASYHCDRLESAGLVVRRRHGQSVWVLRTARGDELADVLSS